MLLHRINNHLITFFLVLGLALAPKPGYSGSHSANPVLIIGGALLVICALGGCKGKKKGRKGGGGVGDAYPMDKQQKMYVQEGMGHLGFYSGKIDGA